MLILRILPLWPYATLEEMVVCWLLELRLAPRIRDVSTGLEGKLGCRSDVVLGVDKI